MKKIPEIHPSGRSPVRIFLLLALVLLMTVGSASLVSAGKPTPTPPAWPNPHAQASRADGDLAHL